MNLETELLKQNRKLMTPAELLTLKEYENQTDVADSDTLSRIGINTAAKKGKETSKRLHELKREIKKFSKERVFHISQIESVCRKYALRFLPAEKFSGSVDRQLAVKIEAFEVNHKVKCHADTSFIMAPASSFKLEPRPKDPLFFYKINDEYFYLIHKWGDDLSAFRRIKGLLSTGLVQIILWALGSMVFAGLFLGYMGFPEETNAIQDIGIFVGISFLTFVFGGLFILGALEIELPDDNNWNKAHW